MNIYIPIVRVIKLHVVIQLLKYDNSQMIATYLNILITYITNHIDKSLTYTVNMEHSLKDAPLPLLLLLVIVNVIVLVIVIVVVVVVAAAAVVVVVVVVVVVDVVVVLIIVLVLHPSISIISV